MDCRGLARVDFFLGTGPDGADRLVVNEVNTLPGFTPISMYPRMWAATGVDFATLVDRLAAVPLTAPPAPETVSWGKSGDPGGRRIIYTENAAQNTLVSVRVES